MMKNTASGMAVTKGICLVDRIEIPSVTGHYAPSIYFVFRNASKTIFVNRCDYDGEVFMSYRAKNCKDVTRLYDLGKEPRWVKEVL